MKSDFTLISLSLFISKFPLFINKPSVSLFMFFIKMSEESPKKLKLVFFRLMLLFMIPSISLTFPLAIKLSISKLSLKYNSKLITNLPFFTLLDIKLFRLEGFVLIMIFFN